MTPPEARELAAEARALAEKFDAFWPSHHAPSDGLGAYLGDGIHACVRSKHVADGLRSLADQVEALQKDHERLEWIIKQTPIAEYSTGAKNFYMGQLPLLHSSIGDMRDAIDRAREAT